ncbi:lamin tail domain-containing protein [Microbacterium halophytorum]|uniref:lamin tail domain-containing protein n=1 Tax=Microbacterium halophytorum TaxID=2067568 RepID=UPI000CFB1B61|nr:lamin tail domain-containing protein [Microbacterium halophytorum]
MTASPTPRRSVRAAALSTAGALLVSTLSLAAVPALAAEPAPPVFVSEIVPDNAGDDHFEYFEVTNTSGAELSLADAGITFSYAYDDSGDSGTNIPLELEADVTLAAGESVVLWLSYTTGKVDSYSASFDDFRAHTGAAADTQVVRVTGQNGFANGGGRTVRVNNASGNLTWSHYPAGSAAQAAGVDFRAPAASGVASQVFRQQAEYTPGAVDAEQLTPGEPAEDDTPDDVADLEPDPDAAGAELQVTELVPDSTNVGGSDGFEFIEVFNASSEPVDFGEYALSYLYPQDTEVNTNEALWPAEPADVTIPAGEALVLWVKNGNNDHLTDGDFNSQYSSDAVLGEDLVEIDSAGMANGSPRGIAIRTNTGIEVNRAYYNMPGTPPGDVAANRGIRYAPTDDATLQEMIDPLPASPGRVQVDQVPGGLVVRAPDAAEPVIEDRTAAEVAEGEPLRLDLGVTDDIRVSTVSVELRNDIDDEPRTVNLLRAEDADDYAYAVAAADVTGKSWYEYTVTASDGTHTVTTEPRRVSVAGSDDAAVRLSVADGDIVGGTSTVAASGDAYPSPIELSIDGEAVETYASLEDAPQFVFETSQTDFYFRNGVRIGEEVLHIFDEGTYEKTETIAVPVPLSHIAEGEPLAVDVWAGTKAGPWIDEGENNDDFVISGMRLVLPDGRTLRPDGYADPTQIIQMGDSTGKNDYFTSEFALPEDAFTAVANDWDTTAVDDGEHTVTATDGTDEAAATVVVDNTAPEIVPSVEDGRAYQGEFALDAEVGDASPVETVAYLDGERIELGHTTDSTTLDAGEHAFHVVATDSVGNSSAKTVVFVIPEENPGADGFAPDDGSEVPAGDVILQATLNDPTDDVLDASFRTGSVERLGDEGIRAAGGEGTGADGLLDGGALAADDLAVTTGLDPVATSSGLPYQVFEIEVPDDAEPDASARVSWEGTANADAQIILYGLRADGSGWAELDRHATAEDGEEFALTGSAPLSEFAVDGTVTALVQHSEGFAGEDLSTRESDVTAHHEEDTPRGEYDFTLAWESDTQYYNEEFTQHQEAIHDYVLDQREAQNIQYMFHTGDVVDDYDQPYQWENADPQYQRLDDAGLPYGVLAGNHDVGHGVSDYTNFGTHFGADRYSSNPWYGGDFENNRGHYDLFTAGGIDFITVYMGWDPQPNALEWMNDVLARYPERVAIIDLHEFLLTTGGLGPVPQQILDEVVATNPNVKMVMSGHYHDAFTRVDEFDDDGDGANDRKVHSMLFDYQGLPEGGLGYLRLMQFDNVGQDMRVRTFSPSLADYNSDEASLLADGEDPNADQDFVISYADLGIRVTEKRLATTGFTAEILGTTEIGLHQGVASGGVATATWALEEPGAYGWYVHTTDVHGGVDDSPVQTFALVESDEEPTPDPVDPNLALGAESVSAGETVRVSVTGFPPDDLVEFSLVGPTGAAEPALVAAVLAADAPIGTLTTDADGAATGGLTIPAGTSPGGYMLRAASGDVLQEAELEVTAADDDSDGTGDDGSDDGGSDGTGDDGSSDDGSDGTDDTGTDDTGSDGTDDTGTDGTDDTGSDGAGDDGGDSTDDTGTDSDGSGGTGTDGDSEDAGTDGGSDGSGSDDAGTDGADDGGSGGGDDADAGPSGTAASSQSGDADASGHGELAVTGGTVAVGVLGVSGIALLGLGAWLLIRRRALR